MTEDRIPSPSDWDLTWDELAMYLKQFRGRGRLAALTNRFFITEKTASTWVEYLDRRDKERRAS